MTEALNDASGAIVHIQRLGIQSWIHQQHQGLANWIAKHIYFVWSLQTPQHQRPWNRPTFFHLLTAWELLYWIIYNNMQALCLFDVVVLIITVSAQSETSHCLPKSGWGMPSALLDVAEERLPRRYSKHPNDVFVLLKAYVSDNQLCQNPLLVLPGDQHQLISTSLSRVASCRAQCVQFWMAISFFGPCVSFQCCLSLYSLSLYKNKIKIMKK